jgi:hypothetical protein
LLLNNIHYPYRLNKLLTKDTVERMFPQFTPHPFSGLPPFISHQQPFYPILTHLQPVNSLSQGLIEAYQQLLAVNNQLNAYLIDTNLKVSWLFHPCWALFSTILSCVNILFEDRQAGGRFGSGKESQCCLVALLS